MPFQSVQKLEIASTFQRAFGPIALDISKPSEFDEPNPRRSFAFAVINKDNPYNLVLTQAV